MVGAGPGGSAAAYHLALRGRRVLLIDRQRLPRDKTCGDGLTRPAVRVLAEMGVLPSLAGAQQIHGVRVVMRGRGARRFEYPAIPGEQERGMVVPRLELDALITERAVGAGAELWDGSPVLGPLIRDDRVRGVMVMTPGGATEVRARVVIAADGARSEFARAVGMPGVDGRGLGFAVRSYWEGIDGLSNDLEIYMPLTDPTDRYVLPSYGWVFPVGPTSANVGVGLFERARGANVRETYERFVKALQVERDGFGGAVDAGTFSGAPLRFDFTPSRAVGPGVLLVGEAAGLVSPFTGEGISYALESGRLAADVIDRNLRPNRRDPDLSDYAIALEQAYAGYFETGRHSARRYQLVWHVLESTFESDRPPFELARRAVLLPEGVGEWHMTSILEDVRPLVARDLRVREDLLAVGEVLVNAVRRDWPFLARLTLAGHGDPGIPLRPALLLLLAAYFGDATEGRLIHTAAAIEAGYLAGVASLGVEEDRPFAGAGQYADVVGAHDERLNWGNMFAVLVADFLLAKALDLAIGAGSAAIRLISERIGTACEGRIQELGHMHNLGLTEAEHLEIIALKTGTLFELPCQLGGELSGASLSETAALAAYGRNLGLAFQLADDALDLAGHPSRLGKPVAADLREGVYSLPVVRVLAREGRDGPLATLLAQAHLETTEIDAALAIVRASGAIEETLALAASYSDRAIAAIDPLPRSSAHRSLVNLARYAVERDHGQGRDADDFFA